jgi:tRNA A-37 threonylcarbamoyl transferase component Bud32
MLSENRVWGAIPSGFEKVTDGGGMRLVIREDRLGHIDFSFWRHGQSHAGVQRYYGRSALRAVRLEDGATALIRDYQHGGFFRRVTGSWFFTWPPRPFRELTITEELRRRGLPTVEVFAACVQQIGGPFYRGSLVTRELSGARDLWAALQEETLDTAARGGILKASAAAVTRMHREGVYHSDLNLKNILIRKEADAAAAYIIDFDKAKLFLGRLPVLLARKNLDRLLRSAVKLDPQRRYLSAELWQEFLSYYHGNADA